MDFWLFIKVGTWILAVYYDKGNGKGWTALRHAHVLRVTFGHDDQEMNRTSGFCQLDSIAAQSW